jgi:TetR/AcrR family transcriptional regulator, transcriptional repressor for nem operon
MKHTKADIVSKGEFLARSKGYYDTSLNDILEECGISKGTFYNYFESKEDYLNQVLESYGLGMNDYMNVVLKDSSKSPIARLEQLYYSLVEMNEKEKCENGCLLINFSEEVGGSIDSISNRCSLIFNGWLERVADCIQEGQEKDEIIKDMNALDLARFIHTSVNGTCAIMKIERSTAPMKQMIDTCLSLITTKSKTN